MEKTIVAVSRKQEMAKRVESVAKTGVTLFHLYGLFVWYLIVARTLVESSIKLLGWLTKPFRH